MYRKTSNEIYLIISATKSAIVSMLNVHTQRVTTPFIMDLTYWQRLF